MVAIDYKLKAYLMLYIERLMIHNFKKDQEEYLLLMYYPHKVKDIKYVIVSPDRDMINFIDDKGQEIFKEINSVSIGIYDGIKVITKES